MKNFNMITTVEQRFEVITALLKQVRDARQALYDSDLGEEYEHLEAAADDGLYSAEGYLKTIESKLEGYDD